jgi:hypothetical protein
MPLEVEDRQDIAQRPGAVIAWALIERRSARIERPSEAAPASVRERLVELLAGLVAHALGVADLLLGGLEVRMGLGEGGHGLASASRSRCTRRM